MLKLWVKDNTNGYIHEYGTNPHDSLYLENGAIHYENLQCCAGTKYPEEGYSFCLEDGTTPDYGGYDGYLDIGGEYYNHSMQPEAEKNKPTTADRIRAMSDEELAEWLVRWNMTRFLENGGAGCMNAAELEDWLQQPAEEESE